MTNHTVLALLALSSVGCDQAQVTPPPEPPAEAAPSTAPPQAATPDAGPNWIDLPADRFASRHDAGAPAPDADVPEATLAPAPPPCRTYYLDEDGDGYGAMPLIHCDLEAAPPVGYVETGGDCCDADANAHPGELAYFTTASLCGSFDYDCDGAEQPEDAHCQLGCGVPCLHSFTAAVPPEACR
jgi:hypothetical protein